MNIKGLSIELTEDLSILFDDNAYLSEKEVFCIINDYADISIEEIKIKYNLV